MSITSLFKENYKKKNYEKIIEILDKNITNIDYILIKKFFKSHCNQSKYIKYYEMLYEQHSNDIEYLIIGCKFYLNNNIIEKSILFVDKLFKLKFNIPEDLIILIFYRLQKINKYIINYENLFSKYKHNDKYILIGCYMYIYNNNIEKAEEILKMLQIQKLSKIKLCLLLNIIIKQR